MIPFDVNVGIVEVIGSDFVNNLFSVVKNAQYYYVAIRTNSTTTVTGFYYNAASLELGFNLTAATSTKGACIVEIDRNLLNGTLITLLNNVGLSTYSPILNTLPENATHCYTYFYFTYDKATKTVKIKVTVTGDVNGDRIDDIKDLAKTAAAYGSTPGSAKWNPACDVNHDSIVDIKDLAIVAKNFGKYLSV
jgi:hypothetical protein